MEVISSMNFALTFTYHTFVELIQLLSGQVLLGDDEDSYEELSVSKKRSTSSLNSNNGNEAEEGGNDNRKGKGKKTKGKKATKRQQNRPSKRPVVLETTPEPPESSSALTAIRDPDGQTACDDDASDGGTNSNSRMSDDFTSDSEGSAMDLDNNQICIQSAKSLLQGASPFTIPAHSLMLLLLGTKRPRTLSHFSVVPTSDPFLQDSHPHLL